MLTAALSLMGAPTAARGQTQQVISIQVTIPQVLFMDCPAPCTFTWPTATDASYTAGFLSSSAGPSLNHRGNLPYVLTMQASQANLNYAPLAGRSDPNPNRPVSDLKLRATTGGIGGSQQTLSTTPVQLYSRATQGPTQTSVLDAQLALSYADNPAGTYSINVTFTIAAP